MLNSIDFEQINLCFAIFYRTQEQYFNLIFPFLHNTNCKILVSFYSPHVIDCLTVTSIIIAGYSTK